MNECSNIYSLAFIQDMSFFPSSVAFYNILSPSLALPRNFFAVFETVFCICTIKFCCIQVFYLICFESVPKIIVPLH
jgi:hypothetical protein